MSVTPRERALNRGHVMDADLRKAERAEAKKNAPKLLPLEAGQKVMIAGGEWGETWGRVRRVLDADRAEIRLDHGGRMIVPRSMLKGGS
jgi:preprotein translocase subunit YajC